MRLHCCASVFEFYSRYLVENSFHHCFYATAVTSINAYGNRADELSPKIMPIPAHAVIPLFSKERNKYQFTHFSKQLMHVSNQIISRMVMPIVYRRNVSWLRFKVMHQRDAINELFQKQPMFWILKTRSMTQLCSGPTIRVKDEWF